MHDQLIQKTYNKQLIEYSRKCYDGIPHDCNGIIGQNPMCGDQIEIYLKAHVKNNYNLILNQIFFESDGCSLMVASANMLKEIVQSISPEYFELQYSLLQKIIEPTHPEVSPKVKLKPFEGVKHFPTRKSCVLLPWQVTERAIMEERKKCGEI